jgi:hypothetical protein
MAEAFTLVVAPRPEDDDHTQADGDGGNDRDGQQDFGH